MKYKIGQKVKILSGTFKGLIGIIQEVNEAAGNYTIVFNDSKPSNLHWYQFELTDA